MPLARLKKNPPASIEPEIANAMITKGPLEVPAPEDIKGYIKEDEIADLAKRDRKTILALSVVEQLNDWQTGALIEIDSNLRELDAKVARRDIELEQVRSQQKEESWKWGIVKWSTVTIMAAIISAFIRWLFG